MFRKHLFYPLNYGAKATKIQKYVCFCSKGMPAF